MPLVVAAPDSYPGRLGAREAATAMAIGAQEAGWDCDVAPVSGGGEGFLDVFREVGKLQVTEVAAPLGQTVRAQWCLGPDPEGSGRTVAIVESALAIGLSLVGGPGGNDPVRASSAGVGQLVVAAIKAGARQVVIGLGGSATTDGGLGAVEALALHGRLPRAELLVACDVETRFLDAAADFSAQKGAGPRQVELLKRRLERVAQLYVERFGTDVRGLEGGGAAGGLAGGLAAIGAKLIPGFDLLVDKLSLAERVAGADLVVTGEGYLDGQGYLGKAVGGVVRLATGARVPLLVIIGDVDPGIAAPQVSLVERFGTELAFSRTAACISDVVAARLASGPRG